MKSLDKLIYEYSIDKLIHSNNIITLTDTHNLDEFVSEVIVKKQNEGHHIRDPFNETKRWKTGVGGELALEKFIGKSFVDLSVGDSKKYHTPDLHKLGLEVGIKTVEYGKYPLIFKNSRKPEIIIIKITDIKFAILGLANVNILNNYQDDTKILSSALRARGTKSGFIGLHMLKQFSNFDELVKLLNI
jgi:hypothetical protein